MWSGTMNYHVVLPLYRPSPTKYLPASNHKIIFQPALKFKEILGVPVTPSYKMFILKAG